MEFDYIYGKQAEQYDYLYIPKAFMKEKQFKQMSATAKILYAVLMEKQQQSANLGWIDEQNHVYIIVVASVLMQELNWQAQELNEAMQELEQIGLLEITSTDRTKVYLKRYA